MEIARRPGRFGHEVKAFLCQRADSGLWWVHLHILRQNRGVSRDSMFPVTSANGIPQVLSSCEWEEDYAMTFSGFAHQESFLIREFFLQELGYFS